MAEIKPQYRALKNLLYTTSKDDAVIQKLRRLETVSRAEAAWKEIEVGDIVDDLPALSIPGLLENGWIEPA